MNSWPGRSYCWKLGLLQEQRSEGIPSQGFRRIWKSMIIHNHHCPPKSEDWFSSLSSLSSCSYSWPWWQRDLRESRPTLLQQKKFQVHESLPQMSGRWHTPECYRQWLALKHNLDQTDPSNTASICREKSWHTSGAVMDFKIGPIFLQILVPWPGIPAYHRVGYVYYDCHLICWGLAAVVSVVGSWEGQYKRNF